MAMPEKGDTAQHKRDMKTYQNWEKKDRSARFKMLNYMHNDLIGQFEGYQTAQEMWNALKLTFMAPNAKMVDHLRKMSAMIRKSKVAGNNLSDEQQILIVLRSLPDSWDQMMTHNESIKTFAQLSHHLKLEAERQEAKGNASMFVADAKSSEHKGS
ncbi:hypothetical protein RJ640_015756 [Escallonia rubra]|uniref:UBN2_2 domain-containing protein n=1 Tax=Escallonia rubra TaxID=112253 RepID=A0AA88QF07_9ASTE|nr:hypothetical protein RJ640_015756 [Escallonia rubra]